MPIRLQLLILTVPASSFTAILNGFASFAQGRQGPPELASMKHDEWATPVACSLGKLRLSNGAARNAIRITYPCVGLL